MKILLLYMVITLCGEPRSQILPKQNAFLGKEQQKQAQKSGTQVKYMLQCRVFCFAKIKVWDHMQSMQIVKTIRKQEKRDKTKSPE